LEKSKWSKGFAAGDFALCRLKSNDGVRVRAT